jgi:hypothetical protein
MHLMQETTLLQLGIVRPWLILGTSRVRLVLVHGSSHLQLALELGCNMYHNSVTRVTKLPDSRYVLHACE